jgi:hypothetical protein
MAALFIGLPLVAIWPCTWVLLGATGAGCNFYSCIAGLWAQNIVLRSQTWLLQSAVACCLVWALGKRLFGAGWGCPTSGCVQSDWKPVHSFWWTPS